MLRLLLGTCAALILCLHWFDAGDTDFGWVVLILGLALAVLPLFTLSGKRAYSPLAMAYLAFAILYGLGILLWWGLRDWEVDSLDALWTGCSALVLGLIGFVIGYGRPEAQARISPARRAWRPDRLLPMLLLLASIGFFTAAALIISAGGLQAYLNEYVEKQLEIFRGWGLYLTVFSPVLSMATLIAYMFHVETKRGRLLFWFMFLSACALNLLISRTQFFLLPAVLALVSVLRRNLSPLRLGVWVLLGAGAFFAFGVLRELTFSDKPLLEDADVLAFFVLIHFDMFDSLMMLIEHPDQWSFTWGGTLFLPLLFKLIPHTVWPDKPPGSERWFMDLFFPGWEESGFNRSAGGVVEYFINFGLVGCFALFAVWGVIGRKLFAWYLARQEDLLCTVLYSYSVISLFFFFRNGFQVWLPYYLAFVLPFIFFVRVMRTPYGAASSRSFAINNTVNRSY